MYNKLKSLDSVKPLSSSVNKALEAARNAEQNSVKEKNTRKRRLTPIAAIAASLVLLLIIGAVLSPLGKTNDTFSLIAYAAENDGLKIGTDFVKLDKVDVTNTETVSDPRRNKYTFKASMNFDVKAEGKDIESITYKADNAFFLLEKKNKCFKSKKGSGERNINLGTEESYMGTFDYNYDAYKEFTVDYNSQPERLKDENGFINARGPVLIYIKAQSKNSAEMEQLIKAYCGYPDTEDFDGDALRTLYKKLINRIKITVTAKHTDGTEETETLSLKVSEPSNLTTQHDLTVNVRRN